MIRSFVGIALVLLLVLVLLFLLQQCAQPRVWI
jgi:hypothetical protein